MYINQIISRGLWPTSVLDPSNFSSGLLVVLSCFLSLFPRASYQLVLSRAWPLTRPRPPKPVRPVNPLAVLASFRRPLGQFFQIVCRFGADRKNMFLGHCTETTKKLNKLTLGGPMSEKGFKKSVAPCRRWCMAC